MAQDIDDDYRITDAVRHMLEQALVAKRYAAGIASDDPLSTKDRLQRDWKTKNEPLEQISLAWAYYVQQLPKEDLVALYSVTPRRIEQKLQASRVAVTALLVHQIVVSSADTPATAPRTETETSPTTNAQHGVWDDALTTRAFLVVLLLVLGVAMWVWQFIPRVSLAVMVLVSSWRMVRHGRTTWALRRYRTHPQDAGQFWWWGGYTALWCGLVAWFGFIAIMVERWGLAPPLFAQRWWPFAWFALGSLVLFAFGMLDMMWWVHHTLVPHWPFHGATSLAAHVWTQRWVMLGIGWALLLALVVSIMAMHVGVNLERLGNDWPHTGSG
jgi:hypothetical protein